MKLIYLEAGSGAKEPVATNVVEAVTDALDISVTRWCKSKPIMLKGQHCLPIFSYTPAGEESQPFPAWRKESKEKSK